MEFLFGRPTETTRPVTLVRSTYADSPVRWCDPLASCWIGPWTPTSVEAWARDMEARWAGAGLGKWMAHARADATLVGRGGLSPTVPEEEPVLEVGWMVREELTGRGYAFETGRAAPNWAATFFPALPLVAFAEVHNVASVAVMRRLSLHSSGVIYRKGLLAGQPRLHGRAPFALFALYRLATNRSSR